MMPFFNLRYTLRLLLKTPGNAMVAVLIMALGLAVASTGMAFLTLALAITGIFAIVSRSVRQRTKEIGIRRAIGSSNSHVLWVFIRQGLRYLGFGLTIGGGAAILAANAINTESVQLLTWLPMTLLAVSVGLGLLVLLATYSPARLLIAMEPGETLRDE